MKGSLAVGMALLTLVTFEPRLATAQDKRLQKIQINPNLAKVLPAFPNPDMRLTPRGPADSIRASDLPADVTGNWGNDNYQRVWINFVGADSVIAQTIYQVSKDGIACFSGTDSGIDIVYGTGLNDPNPRQYDIQLRVLLPTNTGTFQLTPDPSSYCHVLSPATREWQVIGQDLKTLTARVERTYYGKRCSFKLRFSEPTGWRFYSADFALR